jgi:hypothetical protein
MLLLQHSAGKMRHHKVPGKSRPITDRHGHMTHRNTPAPPKTHTHHTTPHTHTHTLHTHTHTHTSTSRRPSP